MKLTSPVICALATLFVGGSALADSKQQADDMARILESFPDISAEELRPSPMAGVYEISLGSRMAYVSADAKYLIQGDLYDVATEQNLTEERRKAARVRSLANLSESSMIVFAPEKATRSITVFTDIDCGYCRKLHREIDGYKAQGIEVRYLFFPRSGPETSSWFKAEEVWCAEDRNTALTTAKAGGAVESEDCGTTPVEEHYNLGRTFGIRGTPAIIADTGELIPGYVSPTELISYLEE
jgi:thiol:disulfide interchange protein DsbC